MASRQGEITTLCNIGNVYRNLGQVKKAINHDDEQALVIAREISYHRVEEHCLGNLGTDYFSIGQYFNSCRVHKSPLEPAIVNAGVHKFIGGDADLIISDSEDVFKCFMQKVIAENSAMTSSLQN